MKVSKIMLASLLGVVAISGAFADEYDGPRNRCKARPDKVWVEREKICVPTDTCDPQLKYSQSDIYKTYCHPYRLSYPRGVQVNDYVGNALKAYYDTKNKTIVQFSSNQGSLCVTLSDGGYKCFRVEESNLNAYNSCDVNALSNIETLSLFDHEDELIISLYTCDEYECKKYSLGDGVQWNSCEELVQVKDDDPKVCAKIAKMAAEYGNQTCTGLMEKNEILGGMDLCRINCKK